MRPIPLIRRPEDAETLLAAILPGDVFRVEGCTCGHEARRAAAVAACETRGLETFEVGIDAFGVFESDPKKERDPDAQ